jgi:DNA adenine methylase
LKWAGGKARVLPSLLPLLPQGRRFIEPFAGSGVVFLNVDYPACLVGEVNPDLVNLYAMLKADPEALIEAARELFVPANNISQAYYALRSEFNLARSQSADQGEGEPQWRKAAIFIYLNRHGFNGMCRYNSKGEFNIPFGAYKAPAFPEAAMRLFAAKLQQVDLYCGDFAVGLRQAALGDVVYCDPPYLPLTLTASFTSYHDAGFPLAEHERLADECEKAAQRGATVIVSNHDVPLAREIYHQADSVHAISVRRNISADGSKRGQAAELIAVYLPKPAGAR